jgi:serine/threonine protein kinase
MVSLKKTLCFLLSCDLFIARLNATDLTVDAILCFETNGRKRDNQVLLENPFSPQGLKKGSIIRLGEKLTSGGYGTIHEGSLICLGEKLTSGGCGTIHEEAPGGRDLIVKLIRPEKGIKGRYGIQMEWDNSKALQGKIAEKVGQDPIRYRELLETDPIIPAIARTVDGSLIQKKISGQDLRKTVSSKRAPYRFGYPDQLPEALIRAANFFRGLALLHHLEFVHCDIKPGNIMIDGKYYLCHIIDLGGMKRFGEKIHIHSSNGAPEFIEPTCAIKDYKAQQKKLLDEQAQIADQMGAAPDSETGERLQERSGAIETQLSEIAAAIEWAQRKRDAVARPAYDIYSSAPILLVILFGKIGYRVANYLYFRQEKDSSFPEKDFVPFRYLQIARRPDFNGEEYFRDRCFELNQAMQKKTGQTYPESMMQGLARLLSRMSSLNPNERPSAIEILQTLESMAFFFEPEPQGE